VTPLVLVHGFMGGSDQWALQAPLKLDRDVIAVDLPGFGQNAHLEPIDSIGGFATWVREHLAASSIRKFDLLGHSMGGMVVQEMVRQEPERVARLILYGTGPVGALPGRFEPIDASIARARRDGREATARRIAATWFLNGEAAEEYAECARIAAMSRVQAIVAGLEAMKSWSGQNHLEDIRSETLILWGDRDRTYAWSQVDVLWRTIPNSHLAVLPGCAHAVHLERPKLFNSIVTEFLAA
jgi:2-hydroxy-6-oxonona-2,4-dienedioate hydrolase